MRAVIELLTVFLWGIVSFFLMIGAGVAWLAMLALGVVSGLSLLLAAFGGIAYLVDPSDEKLWSFLGFLGSSAACFAGIVVTWYYLDKAKDAGEQRQRRRAMELEERQALGRIGGLRLASDVSFNETHRD